MIAVVILSLLALWDAASEMQQWTVGYRGHWLRK